MHEGSVRASSAARKRLSHAQPKVAASTRPLLEMTAAYASQSRGSQNSGLRPYNSGQQRAHKQRNSHGQLRSKIKAWRHMDPE
jgi:hypothetical protein